MSAHDQIRAMLDELMGTTRDGSYLMGCYPGIFEKLVKVQAVSFGQVLRLSKDLSR